MDRNKKYVFQLSESDLAELADVANIQQGEGITLAKNQRGLEISIDKQSLKMWVQAIIRGQEI